MAELEKVIKGLEICIRVQDNEKCPDECPYRKDICYGTVGLMADALSLLKAQEQGWISVKDRLPERPGKYLVVSKTALAELPPHVKTAWFLKSMRDNSQFKYEGEPNEPGFYNGDGEGDWVERYVTYWMPLPKPPKEETWKDAR